MKTLFLISILWLNLTGVDPTAKDKTPATLEQIESKHDTTPTFKYHHVDPVFNISFSVLGYWEGDKGVAYSFTEKKLVEEKIFLNRREFKKYLTPDQELKQFIITPLK